MMDSEHTLILIKRYSGERLYNTVDAHYVTVDDIRIMANEGLPVVVIDAADGRNITAELISERRH